MIILTFDMDWAPDWIMEDIADRLIKKEIPSTWLVTHETPFIKKLLKYPSLFDIGYHPDFLRNSIEKKSVDSIMKKMKSIIPRRNIIRTHCLYQYTDLLRYLCTDHDIRVDLSVYLHLTQDIRSHFLNCKDGKKLLRIPTFFEDDLFFGENTDWGIKELGIEREGLKVFNFHPIHIALNSKDYRGYSELKEETHDLKLVKKEQINKFFNNEKGIESLFSQLIEFMEKNRDKVKSLPDISRELGVKI